MNDYQDRLTKRLLEVNDKVSFHQAVTWVELLWEDFEATYAKAGYKYAGEEMTSMIVSQWIENHGKSLHSFLATNPKYEHLLNQQNKFH